MLTFTFSYHAAARRRERSLTDEQIRAALNEPSMTLPGNRPRSKKYIGHPQTDGRQPVVIASDPPSSTGHVTVITCYFQ